MRIALYILTLSLFFSCSREEPDLISMEGYITNRQTGEPLSGVKVVIFGCGKDDKTTTVYSDKNGYYHAVFERAQAYGIDPFHDILVNRCDSTDTASFKYNYSHFTYYPYYESEERRDVQLNYAGTVLLEKEMPIYWDSCRVQLSGYQTILYPVLEPHRLYLIPGNQDLNFFFYKQVQVYDSLKISMEIYNQLLAPYKYNPGGYQTVTLPPR